MKRVSDVITKEVIETWNNGDVITFKAGTGAGKSFAIKNVLYDYAKANGKKILMLIHRKNCVNQFQDEITRDGKLDIIHIKTYQSLESLKHNHKKDFDFSDYQFIVSDEFHYFLGDAGYNKLTDISLNMILSEENTIRIFMSATGDYMKHYINNIKKIKTIDYELPITYDFIQDLTFFNKDETMEMFIEGAIDKGEKAIFFIQSATKAYELHLKYKEYTMFNCGKSDKHYKYVDGEKVGKMLDKERFEEQILITTTCMDAGVNIIDEDVKHIICDVKSTNIIIQCIGRKRIQNKNDKINLYIKSMNNHQLGGMKTQLKNKLRMADFLTSHTVKEYIREYPREGDSGNMVYADIVDSDTECTMKVNQLMYFKCNLDIIDIEIMKTYGNYGYCKYLANKFGFYDEENNRYTYRTIEENYEKDLLNKYLKSIIGLKLFKDERKELIDNINLRDNRNRIQKSIELLNAYFNENKMNYIIVHKMSSKMEDGKKKNYRYWEVIDNIIK